MEIVIIIFIFIYGLVIGSFLNVVIYRLGTKKSILFGRSYCPNCNKQIVWHDNIPIISYIFLRGRCRQCRKKISIQYILVELTTAIIFAWLYLLFGLSAQFIIYLVFVSFLIVIFVYDLLHYLILDRVSLPAMAIALIGNLYLGMSLTNLILAGAVGASFFAFQYFVSKGKWVGGGDIRLGALMGLMLGWQILLVALFIAYLIGSIIGLGLIAVKKKGMSSQIPFGPFLTFSTFIALIYGQSILSWYLNILG